MTFNRAHSAGGRKGPVPGHHVKEFSDGVEFDMRKYFKVLVPLTACFPLSGNAAMDKVFKAEFIILVDATKSMEQESKAPRTPWFSLCAI